MTDYTEKGDYNFDYKRVVAAFALVYSASIILPLLLFFLVVCMGMKMTLQNSCIFFYLIIYSNYFINLWILKLIFAFRIVFISYSD